MTRVPDDCRRAFRGRATAAAAVALYLFAVCVWAQAPAYELLRIVAPAAEEVVHDNDGNVTVVIALSPALRTKAGDRIRVLLDDRVASEGSGESFALTGIDRGTHSIQVQVTAADGSLLIASEPTTFHMWRASRLFPGR